MSQGRPPPSLPSSASASSAAFPSALSTLLGGSPGQLAMRAQAVLPSFPPLPAASASSSSAPTRPSSSSSSTLSSSPPLTALQQLSRPTSPSQAHSRGEGGWAGAAPPPLPPHPHPQPPASSSTPGHAHHPPPALRVPHEDSSPLSPPSPVSVVAAVAAAGGRRDENVKVSQGMIAFLLEALQTTMFTRKKDAIDTYHTYFLHQHPRYTRPDALLLLFGSPLTPHSTLSTFASTSSFTKIDRGLLAASGQLSWKNHQLRASAAKALGLVALLLDTRYNADAAVFHALLAEADYSVIRLMKLPKHLSQPSPSSSAVGNLQAALRVLDILKDIRPDLIEQLLQEKDVAHGKAAPLVHAHTAPPQALSLLSAAAGNSGPSSGPPPLSLHLLHVSGGAGSAERDRDRDSGASTPKGSGSSAADASPRTPHSPPPLPATHAALHFSTSPATSSFHTAPHPLNLAAVDAAAWSTAAAPAGHPAQLQPHHGQQPLPSAATALPLSAASSPQARSKKHFGTMQGGLHSSAQPPQPPPQPPAQQQQKVQWTSAAPSSASTAGVDDWKQRLRGHLSGFFASRMSREELELKGVLKAPRVFGLSLEQLALHDEVDEASSVPRILTRCMARLSAMEQLQLPGLFRISGDSREIAELKVKWDVGEEVELSAYSPHSVSGLLKMWLRELPEPLLTFELYQPLLDLFRQLQLQHSAAAQSAQLHQPLLDLLDRLPSLHRRTLQALLRFLAAVSSQCALNLMTPNNVAICFSPNILRPRVETLQSVARDTPIAIAVIRSLIEHAQQQTTAPQQPASGSAEHTGVLGDASAGGRLSPPAPCAPPPLPCLSLVLPPSPRGERTPSMPSPSRAPPPVPSVAAPQSSGQQLRSPTRSLSSATFPPPLPAHLVSCTSPTHAHSPQSRPCSPPPAFGSLDKALEESKEREHEAAAAAAAVSPSSRGHLSSTHYTAAPLSP